MEIEALTTKQAAELLGKSIRTVQRLVAANKIEYVDVAKYKKAKRSRPHYLIIKSSFDHYLQQSEAGQ